MLSDLDHSTARVYGTARPEGDKYERWPRRTTFVIDPEGVVQLVYIVAPVQIAGHADQVLRDVDELLR